MNPTPTIHQPEGKGPASVRAGRRREMVASILTALALNLLLCVALLLAVVEEGRRTPPTIQATSRPEPPDDPIEPPKPDRASPAASSGGAPPAMSLPALAAATSEIAMSLPDLRSFDDGLAGLEGFGVGSGFGSGGGGAGTSMGPMMVGKIAVKSQRLGVVLDVSGSMEEELPEVKRELRRAFKQAKTVEVVGCRLDWNPGNDSGERRVRLRSKADTVIEAIEMLVVDGKADAIFWFSDLQDGVTDSGLSRLGELLGISRGKGKAVRFYIRTLQVEPSTELARIVRASDGGIQAGAKGTE